MLIFERQIHHLILLILLLIGIKSFLSGRLIEGSFLNVETSTWILLAIITPILHQVYVWFVWRTELHYSLLTKWFGKNAFIFYSTGFTILFVLRSLFVIALAISNKNSINFNPTISVILSVLLLIPAIYLFYSVKKYFGFKRAFGIDHFDSSYGNLPFVRKGIFRFTDNAMYVYGFFIIWVPGIIFHSGAAILVALFSHIYIWVHYYCTELPDIRRIYKHPK
jgi:Phospholipid methyltransferase